MQNINWGVLFLHCCPNLGIKSIQKIINHFGDDLKKIKNLSSHDLVEIGIKSDLAKKFIKYKESFSLKELIRRCQLLELKIVDINSSDYPYNLKHIHSPPLFLFIKGQYQPEEKPKISIVGSRKSSLYGKQTTKEIVENIAPYFNITSGLAYGIDEITHLSAINKNQSNNAIIASGHSQLTSRQKNLARKIIELNGAIISEYPPDHPAFKYQFPIRNRLISGISDAVLITQATIKSGSLVTAKYALEQNKDILALPGPIDSPTSEGPNQLIKHGAYLISSAQDILDLFQIDTSTEKNHHLQFNDIEQKIISTLQNNPLHINQIIDQTHLESHIIISNIQLLEIKGCIRQTSYQTYKISSSIL